VNGTQGAGVIVLGATAEWDVAGGTGEYTMLGLASASGLGGEASSKTGSV